MKRSVLLLAIMLFFIPTISSAGNIFIEEGELFITNSQDLFFEKTGLDASTQLQKLGVGKTITAKVTNPEQAGKFFREHILMNDGVGIKRIEEDILDLAYGKNKKRIKITGKFLGKLNHIFE